MPTERPDFSDEMSDQELFDNATEASPEPAPEPEPAAPPPEEAPPAPVETTGGRLKDPVTGKFVAKEAKEEPSEPQAEEPSEPQPDLEAEPQMPASVPSWRLAEEAQRRREAEAQTYALNQQLRQMQMQMAQWQEQMQTQAEPLDPVENPQGYQQAMQQSFQKQIEGIRLESNLQLAQIRHGETFDKAYEAFVENSYGGDKNTYDSVMNSPNQGEAIVRWYTQRETMKRIGNDPDKWLQAELDRRMADPEFQAEVIKRFQSQNGKAPSTQQVKLPPSLSRATSAASAAEGELDASDTAMYNFATKR